jgi:capsular polysaccharide biosynthesis protein
VSRRLATATVEVTSRIIVADAAAANTISNKISNDKTAFATSVINDLKTSEAANFQLVTATVSYVAVVSSAPSSETKPVLSVGAIIGIIIGALAAVGIAGYVFYIRGSGSSAKVSSDDPSSDSASDKKMYNNPMPKRSSAKVQSSV